jgi:uncharacterized protein
MFKILSLDGGGIRGTYTAAVLAEIECQLGKPVSDYFDLIVGTSTGGIIALGLSTGMSSEEILEFYKTDGSLIFPPARLGLRGLIRRMFASKFSGNGLNDCLKGVFGATKFCELERNVAITSFNAANGRPIVFRSKYHKSVNRHKKLTLVEVARATSAAPTYFSAAETNAGVMIDGGVWANCPVMVGIADAINLFNCSPRDIRVLSIGTTTTPGFIENFIRDGGLLQWTKPISSVLMNASKLGAIDLAKSLSSVFVRIDDIVEEGRFDMDDASAINELEGMGRDIVRQRYFNELKRQFFHRSAETQWS